MSHCVHRFHQCICGVLILDDLYLMLFKLSTYTFTLNLGQSYNSNPRSSFQSYTDSARKSLQRNIKSQKVSRKSTAPVRPNPTRARCRLRFLPHAQARPNQTMMHPASLGFSTSGFISFSISPTICSKIPTRVVLDLSTSSSVAMC